MATNVKTQDRDRLTLQSYPRDQHTLHPSLSRQVTPAAALRGDAGLRETQLQQPREIHNKKDRAVITSQLVLDFALLLFSPPSDPTDTDIYRPPLS